MEYSYLNSLHELTLSSDDKDILKKFNTIFEEVKLKILTTAYSGFDAVEMRTILKKKQKVQDLEVMITIGLVCGNNIAQIKSIINKKYKNVLLSWENTYKLVSGDDGDIEAVTLSRVIACFPEVTALVLHKNKHPMVISHSSLRAIAAEYPMSARHGVVAGIIPESLKNTDMRDCLSVFMVSNLIIFERFNVDNEYWLSKCNNTRARISLGFLLNSYHTRVVSASKRVKIAKAIGMVVSGSDGLILSDVWRNTAKKCAKWLYSKYNFKVHEEISLD